MFHFPAFELLYQKTDAQDPLVLPLPNSLSQGYNLREPIIALHSIPIFLYISVYLYISDVLFVAGLLTVIKF